MNSPISKRHSYASGGSRVMGVMTLNRWVHAAQNFKYWSNSNHREFHHFITLKWQCGVQFLSLVCWVHTFFEQDSVTVMVTSGFYCAMLQSFLWPNLDSIFVNMVQKMFGFYKMPQQATHLIVSLKSPEKCFLDTPLRSTDLTLWFFPVGQSQVQGIPALIPTFERSKVGNNPGSFSHSIQNVIENF